MNEPVNPYAPPQADITPSPFAEGAMDNLPGLRTTGIGLSLAYYGILIILLAAIVVAFGMVLVRPDLVHPAFVTFILIAGAAMLMGSLMVFAGQITCLAVPSQTGAKGYIIVAVVLQIAGFLQSFLPVLQQFAPNVKLPHSVEILLNSLGVISSIAFVLFMWKLSVFLGRGDLANKARNVLIAVAVLVVAVVAYIFLPILLQNGSITLLGFALIPGGLICFVMYVNLINALRKVLLKN